MSTIIEPLLDAFSKRILILRRLHYSKKEISSNRIDWLKGLTDDVLRKVLKINDADWIRTFRCMLLEYKSSKKLNEGVDGFMLLDIKESQRIRSLQAGKLLPLKDIKAPEFTTGRIFGAKRFSRIYSLVDREAVFNYDLNFELEQLLQLIRFDEKDSLRFAVNDSNLEWFLYLCDLFSFNMFLKGISPVPQGAKISPAFTECEWFPGGLFVSLGQILVNRLEVSLSDEFLSHSSMKLSLISSIQPLPEYCRDMYLEDKQLFVSEIGAGAGDLIQVLKNILSTEEANVDSSHSRCEFLNLEDGHRSSVLAKLKENSFKEIIKRLRFLTEILSLLKYKSVFEHLEPDVEGSCGSLEPFNTKLIQVVESWRRQKVVSKLLLEEDVVTTPRTSQNLVKRKKKKRQSRIIKSSTTDEIKHQKEEVTVPSDPVPQPPGSLSPTITISSVISTPYSEKKSRKRRKKRKSGQKKRAASLKAVAQRLKLSGEVANQMEWAPSHYRAGFEAKASPEKNGSSGNCRSNILKPSNEESLPSKQSTSKTVSREASVVMDDFSWFDFDLNSLANPSVGKDTSSPRDIFGFNFEFLSDAKQSNPQSAPELKTVDASTQTEKQISQDIDSGSKSVIFLEKSVKNLTRSNKELHLKVESMEKKMDDLISMMKTLSDSRQMSFRQSPQEKDDTQHSYSQPNSPVGSHAEQYSNAMAPLARSWSSVFPRQSPNTDPHTSQTQVVNSNTPMVPLQYNNVAGLLYANNFKFYSSPEYSPSSKPGQAPPVQQVFVNPIPAAPFPARYNEWHGTESDRFTSQSQVNSLATTDFVHSFSGLHPVYQPQGPAAFGFVKQRGLSISTSGSPYRDPKDSHLTTLTEVDLPESAALGFEIQNFENYCEEKRSNRTEVEKDLLRKVKEVVKQVWPRALVRSFGSFRAGLNLPKSDIDLVVTLPPVAREGLPQNYGLLESKEELTWQQKLESELLQSSWVNKSSLKTIARAKVPLVRFRTESEPPIRFDISFASANHHGIVANGLLDELLRVHPIIRPLILILKHQLRKHQLGTAYTGGLSSYALTLLLACFLRFHIPFSSSTTRTMNGPLARRNSSSQLSRSYESGASENELIGDLYLRFLKFFSDVRTFDAKKLGISLSQGFFDRTTVPNTNASHRFDVLFIEDPLQPQNNVGATCFRWSAVQKLWQDTANFLCREMLVAKSDKNTISTEDSAQSHAEETAIYPLLAQIMSMPG